MTNYLYEFHCGLAAQNGSFTQKSTNNIVNISNRLAFRIGVPDLKRA